MDFIDIALGIATVVGTLFGAISIYDARKSKKELEKYTYLFDLAEKNIDKKLTSEEINRLHEEKQAMDKIIKEEIPRQARLTVLYDRLKADEEYLSSSYSRYKQTQKEYEKIKTDEKIEIPKNILDEIEHQILPNYLIKEQQQKYMSMLTIISYATALLSIIPMFDIVSRYSMLFSAYPLICIFGLNMPKEKHERKKYLLNIAHNFVLVILFMLNLYIGLVVFENVYFGHRVDAELKLTFNISLLFFMLLLIPKIIIFLKKHRDAKKGTK